MRKEMKNKNMEEANKNVEMRYQKSKKSINKDVPEVDKDTEDKKPSIKTDKKKEEPKKSSSSTQGAVSGDSDVRSPTSTDVRSPTSTETSTDAYTSGNVTVTGGAGANADTTVNISAKPENYKRLKTPPAKTKSKSALSEELDKIKRMMKTLLG